MLRAEEEISRLKEEMSNSINYFIGIYSKLTENIALLKQNHKDTCNIGCICLLKQSLRKYRIILSSLLQLNKYIDISQLECFLQCLNDDLEQPIDSPVDNEETMSALLAQSSNDEFCNRFDEESDDDIPDLMDDDGTAYVIMK